MGSITFGAPQADPQRVSVTTEDLQPVEGLTDFEKTLLEANKIARDKLAKSQTLPEFMMYTNTVRTLEPDKMSWAEEYAQGYTADTWIDEFSEERDRQRFAEMAELASGMLGSATSEELPQGQARLVVKKTGEGSDTEYHALALLEGSSHCNYDIDHPQETPRKAVFMKLTTACCFQASEEVLQGEGEAVIDIPDQTLTQMVSTLGLDLSVAQQNFRYRNEQGETTGTRDQAYYLLFATKGGFLNEKDMYLLSDYYYREH